MKKIFKKWVSLHGGLRMAENKNLVPIQREIMGLDKKGEWVKMTKVQCRGGNNHIGRKRYILSQYRSILKRPKSMDYATY